jgi:hypothetical protein
MPIKSVLQPVRQGEDIKAHTVRYIDGDKLGGFVQRASFPAN